MAMDLNLRLKRRTCEDSCTYAEVRGIAAWGRTYNPIHLFRRKGEPYSTTYQAVTAWDCKKLHESAPHRWWWLAQTVEVARCRQDFKTFQISAWHDEVARNSKRCGVAPQQKR
ncbi:uncharacterized protein LOC135217035 [Macrobrachium nipponense]|uniref:uncharacterized protein LOC135217035 n=1 Tax=Macrobrachium nipponense TaxID=159736 RepID=UPI0030C8192D